MGCAASTDPTVVMVDSAVGPLAPVLDAALELHPHAVLRPEPFGALGYHYDTRRLVFVNDADLVAVVGSLADHDSLHAALERCEIAPSRRGSFVAAIERLIDAGLVRERAH